MGRVCARILRERGARSERAVESGERQRRGREWRVSKRVRRGRAGAWRCLSRAAEGRGVERGGARESEARGGAVGLDELG